MIALILNLADIVKDGISVISEFFFQDWLFTTLFTWGDKVITPASLLFGYGLILFIRFRLAKIILDLLT